jgi:signal transduction histidine kinase
LSNAVKFTHTGTITVTACSHNGAITIAVADTGIGIPEAALDHVFEEFRQVDSTRVLPIQAAILCCKSFA